MNTENSKMSEPHIFNLSQRLNLKRLYTYLVMEKRILILYENNYFITSYKKNCFFLKYIFFFLP